MTTTSTPRRPIPANDPAAAADAYAVGLVVKDSAVVRRGTGFELYYADGSSSVHNADGDTLGRWAA